MKKLLRKQKHSMILLFGILFTMLSIAIGGYRAYAASQYMDIKLFQKNQTLNMPRNTVSYWFNIPAGTVMDDQCYLHLDLKLSETLLHDRSSITLAINETKLETKWILDLDKTTEYVWEVAIPADAIRIGEQNELKITTAQRSIEGDCADIDNPANWVEFQNTSYLHIAIKEPAKPVLKNFYNQYFNFLGNNNSLNAEFVLPEKATAIDEGGLMQVASAIGANFPYNDTISYKVSKGKASASELKNKIFVGMSFDSGTERTDNGYLSIGEDASGLKTTVTGTNDTGFQKSLNFISDSDFLNTINRAELKVSSDISNRSKTAHEIKNESGFYSFEDYGYESTNLAGAFHQSASFQFQQPNGLKSGDDSYILIRFRHSNALVAENSLMTVYFDNIAAGSVKLSASNADYGELKVAIPDEVRDKNTVYVTVDCYNYLGKIDCSKDWSDTAWTVIDKCSEIYFEPGDLLVAPTLYNIPTYYNNGTRNNILVNLPTEYTEDELTIGALLATRGGQNSRSYSTYQVTTQDQIISENQRNMDMIFIGSYDKLSLPSEIQSSLGISPKPSGGFLIDTRLTESSETLLDKMVFEVIRSPWNYERKIYVITYDKGMEDALIQLLSDKTMLQQINGQVTVADKNGVVSVHTLTNKKENADRVPLNWERIKYLVEKKTGFSIYIVIATIIVIIIAIIIMITVIRNKKQFKQAAKKMQKINDSAPEESELAESSETADSSDDSENSDDYGDGEENE